MVTLDLMFYELIIVTCSRMYIQVINRHRILGHDVDLHLSDAFIRVAASTLTTRSGLGRRIPRTRDT